MDSIIIKNILHKKLFIKSQFGLSIMTLKFHQTGHVSLKLFIQLEKNVRIKNNRFEINLIHLKETRFLNIFHFVLHLDKLVLNS